MVWQDKRLSNVIQKNEYSKIMESLKFYNLPSYEKNLREFL